MVCTVFHPAIHHPPTGMMIDSTQSDDFTQLLLHSSSMFRGAAERDENACRVQVAVQLKLNFGELDDVIQELQRL